MRSRPKRGSSAGRTASTLWIAQRVFIQVPAQALVARYLDSFKDFSPRSKPASFTVSDAMEKIEAAAKD